MILENGKVIIDQAKMIVFVARKPTHHSPQINKIPGGNRTRILTQYISDEKWRLIKKKKLYQIYFIVD